MPKDTLTDKGLRAELKKAAESGKPITLNDGDGLICIARPDGAGWWRLRYWIASRENRLSLGVYPEVSLREARERRDDAKKLIAKGIDPGEVRKAEKAERERHREAKALADAGLPGPGTFEHVAREWLRVQHEPAVSAGHAERTRIRFENDVFPWIGKRPIGEIEPPELLKCIRRIEARGAAETAHRTRDACGQVFRFGVSSGYCARDTAADIKDALGAVLSRHLAAVIEPAQFGALLRAIDGYQGHPVTRAALKLSALLLLRPGELRHLQWSWIDFDTATATLPATLMKRTKAGKVNGAPHVVPLAPQAVAILRDLHPLTGTKLHVFPSLHTGERPMSENTVNVALRRMGYDRETATAHGFRASARTMLAERLDIPQEVIEAQLAHAVADALGRAYNRTQFLDQRRVMMNRWADYLDQLRDGAQVIPIKQVENRAAR